MRLSTSVFCASFSSFNSRTPGGVRRGCTLSQIVYGCFNSRTPGGVRRARRWISNCGYPVSIHAPREGCDLQRTLAYSATLKFQFTHPGRGATSSTTTRERLGQVSIHAPREGCDPALAYSCHRGEEFQFTHPGRGATVWCKVAYYGADKQA